MASKRRHVMEHQPENPRLPVEERLSFLFSHIVSKSLFQSATWSAMSQKSYDRIHELVMTGYRMIANRTHNDAMKSDRKHVSDKDVIGMLKAPAPELLLMLA